MLSSVIETANSAVCKIWFQTGSVWKKYIAKRASEYGIMYFKSSTIHYFTKINLRSMVVIQNLSINHGSKHHVYICLQTCLAMQLQGTCYASSLSKGETSSSLNLTLCTRIQIKYCIAGKFQGLQLSNFSKFPFKKFLQ